MKVIILAGGLGTRISEETADKPKPMVLIDGRPILWHVMSIFASQGHTDFMVATGYKKHVIENWVKELEEDWSVQLVDTGLETQTGGRIKLLMRMFPNDRFFVTYGDGVANVNLKDLLAFHESKGKKATVTAVRPPARFGHLETKNGEVIHFGEKNQSDAGWINGGFFCFEPEVAEYIKNVLEPLETGALPRLVHENQLSAYHHYGFWQPMDTLREKQELERLVRENSAPWLEMNNHKA